MSLPTSTLIWLIVPPVVLLVLTFLYFFKGERK